MRVSCTVAAAALAAFTLVGCTAPPPAPPSETPTPTATHSRDVAAAYRCLADHSPWTVDLDDAFRAWQDAAATEHELRGGTISGTATLRFTRGEQPHWSFTAGGVAFELFFADGARETIEYTQQLAGDYLVPEPGGALELLSVEVTEAHTDVVSLAADGTPSEVPRVAAPRFPWDADVGTALSFACTEHRLLVSAPGETPDTWDLSPG